MGGGVVDHDLHRDGYATKYGHHRRFGMSEYDDNKLRKFQYTVSTYLVLPSMYSTSDVYTPSSYSCHHPCPLHATSSSFPSALPIPVSPSYATVRFAYLTAVVPTPQSPQGVKASRHTRHDPWHKHQPRRTSILLPHQKDPKQILPHLPDPRPISSDLPQTRLSPQIPSRRNPSNPPNPSCGDLTTVPLTPTHASLPAPIYPLSTSFAKFPATLVSGPVVIEILRGIPICMHMTCSHRFQNIT